MEKDTGELTFSLLGKRDYRPAKIQLYIEGNQFEEEKLPKEQKITSVNAYNDI